MKAKLIPTFLTVQCRCNKIVNVRTNQPDVDIYCWNCNRVIHVHLGTGRNNLSVTVDGNKVRPLSIIQ